MFATVIDGILVPAGTVVKCWGTDLGIKKPRIKSSVQGNKLFDRQRLYLCDGQAI